MEATSPSPPSSEGSTNSTAERLCGSRCSAAEPKPSKPPGCGSSALPLCAREQAPRGSNFHHHRHRAVVDEGDAHAGAKDAFLRPESLAEAVVERLGVLSRCRVRVA